LILKELGNDSFKKNKKSEFEAQDELKLTKAAEAYVIDPID